MEHGYANDALTAVDAQRGLLGILIRYPDRLEQAAELKQSDFTGAERQGIFSALNSLRKIGEEPDMVALSAEVKKLTGGDADVEIVECTSLGVTPHLLKQYMRMVRQAADRRRCVAIARRLEERSADPATDVQGMLTGAIDALKDLFHAPGELPHTPEVMTDGYMMLDDILSGARSPVPTGIQELDECITGFYPAELTIVGARSGTGKSAFAISTALAAAAKGARVLFVSTEMSREQLGVRLLANLSGVPMSVMRSAKAFTQEQWDRLAGMLVDDGSDPISWLTGERGMENIFARVRAMRAEGKCDMLIVDYLQQLHSGSQNIREEWLRLGRISLGLKELAVDLQLPVVVTAQLNRANEGEVSPGLDSLRGSGSLEQDADNVILLSTLDADAASEQPELMSFVRRCHEQQLSPIMISVAKQRQGATKRFMSAFDGEHMRFVRPKE